MDIFQRLPEEIILLILHQLDFLGLHALISLSPRARLVIDLSLFDLTDYLLSRCSTTSVDNYRWFYCTVLIHMPPPSSYKTLDDFRLHRDNITSLKSLCSPQNEASLRCSIYVAIETAARIQRLACACLWKLQHKLHEATRAALHFRSIAQDSPNWDNDLATDWEQTALSPPSWIEDFRVHRSLWCLQVFIDLRRAAGPEVVVSTDRTTGSVSWGGWDWDLNEIDKIDDFVHCKWAGQFRAKDTEIPSVAGTLEELGATYLHVPPEEESLPEGYRPYRCPIFESLSIANIQEYPTWSSKPVPEESYIRELWRQSPRYVEWISKQDSAYSRWLTVFQKRALFGEQFAVQKTWLFQRWGFFIWDSWRLWSLGLLEVLECSETRKSMAGEVMSPIDTQVNLHQINKSELCSRWCALNQMRHLAHRDR